MYSNFHPLSNYYTCPITFRKQKYRSLEQAYQHCKSTFFGQAESASRIMASRDPAEAKRISYDVSGPRDLQNKWDAQRVDLMTSLVRAKCDQNPLVLRELQSTGTKIIGESGKDRFYGTGLSITHSDILNIPLQKRGLLFLTKRLPRKRNQNWRTFDNFQKVIVCESQ